MAHPYKLTKLPVHIDEFRNNSSPPITDHRSPITEASTPRTPDPLLPLFDDRDPAPFSHRRQAGRVFGQLTSPGSDRNHPSQFYIEWAGDYHPISGLKLVSILGTHSSGVKSLSRSDMARILGSLQITFPLAQLLNVSRA